MMLNILLPAAGALLAALKSNRQTIATQAGVAPEVVEKVSTAFEAYLTQDERARQQLAKEIDAARQHDIATHTPDIYAVNLARGLIRPSITFMAFGWYVYARYHNIALTPEDYAIIGGILAFWFGLRPFEKHRKTP